ncbi:MAG: HAMP domain-containing histidine kinase [Campylobacterales bacterium]|nr:HAMP domain-containing histidine kinase [Campylobacterales bacterium]
MHSKNSFFLTLLYMLTTLIMVATIYLYLDRFGYSPLNFVLSASVGLFFATTLGYLLISYIVERQKELDEALLHITKETLHELNIPISTIQANSAMIAKTLTDTKTLKRLKRINEASKRLERLYIELSYSIKKQIATIEKEPFGLEALLCERVETLMELGRNPIALHKPILLTLYLDKIGFEKVIDNLLHNAMKYSDKAAPIDVFVQDNKLHIVDRGIGIDESQMVAIFERYFQASHKSQGKGIGLALVKSYCDRYRIGIDIKSTKGEGTTVILDLKNAITPRTNIR